MIALLLAALALIGDDLDALIRQLGSERVEEREAATLGLMQKGPPARDRLEKELTRTRDLEVAVRLRRILKHYENLISAEAILITVSKETIGLEPTERPRDNWWKRGSDLHPVDRIVRLKAGGFACLLTGDPTVIADRTQPQEALIPLLRADIDRPFEIDPPAGLEMLTRIGGFSNLISALEARLSRTSDPIVRRVCRRAIERQQKGKQPCTLLPSS